MAKMNSAQLGEMIRLIVKQEIRETVMSTINEVLSERYLRQLAESAASRPRGVGRTMHIADGDDNDEEGTPSIMRNNDRGIYAKHPSIHEDKPEEDSPNAPELSEDHERNEMLSMFFEGTKPLTQVEEQADEGIPLEVLNEKFNIAARAKTDVRHFKDLFDGANAKSVGLRIQKDPVAEERRIAALRESLDRPA